MKKLTFGALLLCLLNFVCYGQTIRVMAAASLKESLTQCANSFESSHPGVTIQMSFGGSDSLATSILLGGGVDLFLSADRKQMLRVLNGGRAVSQNIHPLLTNELAIIVPSKNRGSIYSIRDLARPKIRIALAKSTVPAGAYARSMLTKAAKVFGPDFYNKVMANVVTNDLDVRDVLAHVSLGEVDAGFVYITDAGIGGDKVKVIHLPKNLETRATYSIAVLKTSAHPKIATQFLRFLIGEKGQSIFQKWGFGPRN